MTSINDTPIDDKSVEDSPAADVPSDGTPADDPPNYGMYIFDAYALVAYLNDEPGAAVVEQLLRDNPFTCHAHALSIFEVFSAALRTENLGMEAKDIVVQLTEAGLHTLVNMEDSVLEYAAKLKAAYQLSTADAFALALSQQMAATFMTIDRPELKPLIDGGMNITFIR